MTSTTRTASEQTRHAIVAIPTNIHVSFSDLFEPTTALSNASPFGSVKSRVGFDDEKSEPPGFSVVVGFVVNDDDDDDAVVVVVMLFVFVFMFGVAVVVIDGVMLLMFVFVLVKVIVLVIVLVVVVGVVGSMLGSMHLPFTRVRPVRHVSHVSPVEQVVHVRAHSKHLLSLPYLPRGHFE